LKIQVKYMKGAEMKCPKCGEEVYDFYTTKERIAELYSVNTVAMWARNNLLIL